MSLAFFGLFVVYALCSIGEQNKRHSRRARDLSVGLYAQGFLRDLVGQMVGRKREGVPLEELVIEDPMKVSAPEQCRADIERLRAVVKMVRFE